VQGLYIDLDPLVPPWDVVPRYGIHGDDPVNQPTSPSQFWLGLTVNIPVMDGPENFHRTSGWPGFIGWPTWENGGHQQMYYKWLERAYQGGLRLLINLAVNNEVLCEMSFQRQDFQGEGNVNCPDMPTVDRQIDRIYELEGFVDLENDGQLNGNGWYRVAKSAGEARDIIEDGAMAVIIGIEVDTLFGCKPDTNYCCQPGPDAICSDLDYTSYEDFIDKKVQEYYDKGVRYIYPVHFWNNKFTGGAPYRDYFVYSQVLANGTCFDLYECSELGYDYSIGGEIPALDFVFESITQKLDMPECTEYGDYEAVCNQLGLTEEGFRLIDELIERDMLIDQDHLPLHATWGYSVTVGGEWQHWPGLLDIAEDWDDTRGYKYPVVSSHSSVKPDYNRGAEGGTFWSAAERIRDLGGVISVPQPRGECSTTRQFIDGSSGAEVKFTLPLDLLGDLEANEFTQALWDAFATNGYTLTMPYTGTVEVETVQTDTGVEWRIQDSDPTGGARFRVKEVDSTLNVYHEFTLPPDLLDDLEANQFTQGLWDAFATNGYTLTMPYTGTVEVETVQTDTGVEWQIQGFGPTGGARFRVKKVDSTLNVHRESYGLGYVEQAEFMSRGLPEEHQDYPRIGLRSDFGAFLPQAAPRFVWDETEEEYEPRCDEDDAGTELDYAFPAFDGSGEFDMQVTGNRDFDFNTEGLAHVGLWLDLLADAREISDSNPPTTTVDFDPIFNSAEAYIRMWEWIENCTPDEVPPDITCPGTIITSGGVGGTTVAYEPPPAATDLCDWIPPDVHVLTTDPISGSLFETGVHTVTATATDFSGNASQCSFNVQMSCFQVNHARIGVQCMGLAELDLVYNGPDGAQVDVGDFGSFEVDDGDHILLEAADLGQEVLSVITQLQIGRERTTIPTACAAAIHIGDVFGPFTVQQLAWVFDDDAPPQKVEIKGTFRPAAPVDLTTVDVTYTIDDGQGGTLTYVIPAGSFQVEGKASLQKFRYDSPKGAEPGIHARFDFGQYTFELSLDGVDTYGIAEADLTIGLQTGQGMQRHYGLETVPLQITPRQLDYLVAPQWDCSP
jgi:hypothetical protein